MATSLKQPHGKMVASGYHQIIEKHLRLTSDLAVGLPMNMINLAYGTALAQGYVWVTNSNLYMISMAITVSTPLAILTIIQQKIQLYSDAGTTRNLKITSTSIIYSHQMLL